MKLSTTIFALILSMSLLFSCKNKEAGSKGKANTETVKESDIPQPEIKKAEFEIWRAGMEDGGFGIDISIYLEPGNTQDLIINQVEIASEKLEAKVFINRQFVESKTIPSGSTGTIKIAAGKTSQERPEKPKSVILHYSVNGKTQTLTISELTEKESLPRP
jgi:hypothetical protein